MNTEIVVFMENVLRAAGWEKNLRNLWVNPERPHIAMSLQTAYNVCVKKGKPRRFSIAK